MITQSAAYLVLVITCLNAWEDADVLKPNRLVEASKDVLLVHCGEKGLRLSVVCQVCNCGNAQAASLFVHWNAKAHCRCGIGCICVC